MTCVANGAPTACAVDCAAPLYTESSPASAGPDYTHVDRSTDEADQTNALNVSPRRGYRVSVLYVRLHVFDNGVAPVPPARYLLRDVAERYRNNGDDADDHNDGSRKEASVNRESSVALKG